MAPFLVLRAGVWLRPRSTLLHGLEAVQIKLDAIAECPGMLLLRPPRRCTCSAMPALPFHGDNAEPLCLPLCTDGDVITAAAMELDQLPDHLLSDILHQISSLVDC